MLDLRHNAGVQSIDSGMEVNVNVILKFIFFSQTLKVKCDTSQLAHQAGANHYRVGH